MGLSAPDAVLQKRPAWIRIAGQLVAGMTAGSVVAWIFEPASWSLGTTMFFGGLFGMLVLAGVSRSATRTARGPLSVDEHGITVGDRTIAAEELKTGLLCEVVDSRGIVLRPRGSTTTIAVDEWLLRPLVESLRLHFRARPRFPVFARTSPWATFFTIFAMCAGMVTVAVAGGQSSFFVGLLAALAALLASIVGYRELGKRTLTVGADGIAVRTPIGTEMRIPYSQVASVLPFGADVHVLLKDGALYRVGFGMNASGGHLERCMARAAMLAWMVENARSAYERAGAFGETGRKAAILARGGRAIAEWMSALRGLNEEQASFRSATINDDELWRITEDPTEHEPVRVAAAVALRERLDEGGRVRLRLVADSCIAPRLRVALDAAVDRDDASLAQALEALEEPDEAERALKAVRNA